MGRASKSPMPGAPSKRGRRRSGGAVPSPQRAKASGGAAGDGLSKIEARQLLAALRELKKGPTTLRLPTNGDGLASRIATELNAIIEREEDNSRKLARMANVIGAVAEGDLS